MKTLDSVVVVFTTKQRSKDVFTIMYITLDVTCQAKQLNTVGQALDHLDKELSTPLSGQSRQQFACIVAIGSSTKFGAVQTDELALSRVCKSRTYNKSNTRISD